jgi:hypothetical protein
MKYLIIILTLLISVSCQRDTNTNYDLGGFNQFLGKEKSEALDNAVSSFETFLKVNFPNQKTFEDQARAFLQYIRKYEDIDSTWVLDTNRKSIYEKLESSGMRKEMIMYWSEIKKRNGGCYIEEFLSRDYDDEEFIEVDSLFDNPEIYLPEESLPITYKDSLENVKRAALEAERDSSIEFNIRGKFIYGLVKYSKKDTCIVKYADVIYRVAVLSLPMLTEYYLEYFPLLDNEFYKRMLIADYYIYILKR